MRSTLTLQNIEQNCTNTYQSLLCSGLLASDLQALARAAAIRVMLALTSGPAKLF